MNTKRMLRLIVVLSVVLIAAGNLAAAIASPSTPLLAEAVAPQADNFNPPAPPIPLEAAGDDLASAMSESSVVADNPSPPASPVKLIFIHHSCGEYWLDDEENDDHAGELGATLDSNNYFVSDTNYEWGPDDADLGYEKIGDHTDIGHWYNWFVGPHRDTYLSALYNESGQHSWYTRSLTDPGGENRIIMFKSCYPNSNLRGNPTDSPTTGDNPLRGEASWSEHHTVANAKGIYNDLLGYFATCQDRLFIVITAPPVQDSTWAANARAFNNWLVNDWLASYSYNNVAVFDFYNVLTSHGGDSNTNDLGQEEGNHHRWWNGAVQHQQTVSGDTAAYPSEDDHPSRAGNLKATGEFVELLNVYYNRWRGGAAPSYTFNAVITPTNATQPITYTWSPDHLISGQGTARATYQWDTAGVYNITLEAENCGGTFTATHTITISASSTGYPHPLTDASISDSTLAIHDATAQPTMIFQDGVSPSVGYTGTTDVILASDEENVAPNANLGGLENLETFYGDAEHRRSLMRWDLSALPGGVTVQAATLELYRYESGVSNDMQLALYRVTSDWAEGTGYDLWPGPSYVPDGATWLTATTGVAWTTPGGDYDTTIVGQTTLPAAMENGWLRLDATAAVQAWVAGGQPNHGLLLRPLSGDYTYHYFHSREAITATLHPRLVVTYTTESTSLTLVTPNSSTSWPVSSTQQIRWNTNPPGSVSQVNLHYSFDSFAHAHAITSFLDNTGIYTWTTPPTPTNSVQVRVQSAVSPTTVYDVSDNFTLYATTVYLPLILKNHGPPPCPYPLTDVSISGPTSGSTAVTAPDDHTEVPASTNRQRRNLGPFDFGPPR